MSCHDDVAAYFLEEALISVFLNDFYLLNIIMVVPPLLPESKLVKKVVVNKQIFKISIISF